MIASFSVSDWLWLGGMWVFGLFVGLMKDLK